MTKQPFDAFASSVTLVLGIRVILDNTPHFAIPFVFAFAKPSTVEFVTHE